MSAPHDAVAQQIRAALPGRSTWLSANAGSGKTRVLTDRVARLLLEGASPQNILCLTYTKAAASEMQNRLFRRLGEWAMVPDDALRDALAALGLPGGLDAARLARARTLFARAIETPGGLRIQTIHSFCAALLRQFPLEAVVSPQFEEMDERAARLLTGTIVEEMADTLAPEAVADLARHHAGDDLSALIHEISGQRDQFLEPLDEAELFANFGLRPDETRESVIASAFDAGDPALRDEVAALFGTQSPFYAAFGGDLARIDLTDPGEAEFRELCRLFLYASGDRKNQSKSVNFPQATHKNVRAAVAPVLPGLHGWMDRIALTFDRLQSLGAVEKSLAIHRFARLFLPLYEARKRARGWLDFEDLILGARALLTDSAVASWVLFRLDGGIDHILVDEAQDTSPPQWQVIERLTQEFAAGQGAREAGERTLFVVGDRKQSIYSFQGADPREFLRMQDRFGARMAQSAPLQSLELHHSFRSSAAILNAVDAVFAGSGTRPEDLAAQHRPYHADLPGRVDLWPALPAADKDEDAPWYDPVDKLAPNAAEVQLARAIARHILETIERGETIPAQNGTRRPVRAGDFLILVQRRNRLFVEIIRACKQQGLDIAGSDRLRLAAELAVRDLRALLSFLATPGDDLSLAAALRSPLFGLSEAELFDLAAGRGQTSLWNALRARRDAHPEIVATLDALRRDTDYLRPYDLLERILLRHGGRPRLLARLGDEARDGLDELLNQALNYERMDIPSLTGFLAWLEADDVEIRRQSDAAGQRIRVMSVHGAKGLESPIVILPDTLRTRRDISRQLFPAEDGTLLWRTSADAIPAVLRDARARLVAADDEERARLLYVAMTRAETWLIVCGAGKVSDPTWYLTLDEAMSSLPSEPIDTPMGPGRRHSHGDWRAGETLRPAAAPAEVPALPAWVAVAPPKVAPPAPLRASDLGGAKTLAGEADPALLDAALERGSDIHLLLEHLPGLPARDWADAAVALVGADRATGALDEVRASLEAPHLVDLFAAPASSEVPLSARWPGAGGRRLIGTLDRLIVTADDVLAIDYKSNRLVPEGAEDVPEGILRQMGAYACALEEIFPGRPVRVALLWTRTATLMPLPGALIRSALARIPD